MSRVCASFASTYARELKRVDSCVRAAESEAVLATSCRGLALSVVGLVVDKATAILRGDL